MAETLTFPRRLLPPGGSIYAVKIQGDSMSPILESGHIVLIDVSHRDPARLVNRMVAARNSEGITVKWLRNGGKDVYLLVPQQPSQAHQIQVMRAEGDWSVVGEVVKWIGEPPPPKKR